MNFCKYNKSKIIFFSAVVIDSGKIATKDPTVNRYNQQQSLGFTKNLYVICS